MQTINPNQEFDIIYEVEVLPGTEVLDNMTLAKGNHRNTLDAQDISFEDFYYEHLNK